MMSYLRIYVPDCVCRLSLNVAVSLCRCQFSDGLAVLRDNISRALSSFATRGAPEPSARAFS